MGAVYYAHVSEDGERCETVERHVGEVAEMAAAFAEPFGGAGLAYAAGLMHDVGKFSEAFQRRLLKGGPKVDHATEGAAFLFEEGYSELAYCVAGHHGGLPDGGTPSDVERTLFGRVNKAERGGIPDASAWRRTITFEAPDTSSLALTFPDKAAVNFGRAFLTRMLFSCLVDADYLCTERFMRGEGRPALKTDAVPVLRDRLERRLAGFYPPQSQVNETRCGVLDDCLDASMEAPGVFTLTAPTGSGKTYALMRFALNHACRPGSSMRRVVVAEPYTSIIEQNAEVYRRVLGDENVLEHHMNFDFDEADERGGGLGSRLRLASENWDAPVVVTTNVQLLESLFSSKTSRCRKLHNIAGSVIVLDEAQAIPMPFLKPCVRALVELVRNYGCSVVLCSATQPALDSHFSSFGMPVKEIITDVAGLFLKLKRVRYQAIGSLSDGELVERLSREGSALCIVNSRKQARALFELVRGGERGAAGVFHLTTLMYPEHRKRVLSDIYRRMRTGEPCLVIATSLVEAGVDLDFPVVYRALAGVDSMVQAAGRCNREGKRALEQSVVYLFSSSEGYRLPSEVDFRKGIARSAVPELKGVSELDLDDPRQIEGYFHMMYLYRADEDLDREGVLPALSDPSEPWGIPSYPYRAVDESFRLIADGSFSVIIPDPEIEDAVERLGRGEVWKGDLRRIARYSVSVYKNTRDSFAALGIIRAVADDTYVLADERYYQEETGLEPNAEGGDALFF